MTGLIACYRGEAGTETGQDLVVTRPGQDELLTRESEHSLDHEVVHRHRLREVTDVTWVLSQLRGDVLQVHIEERTEARPHPLPGRTEPARQVAVTRSYDLLEPPVEEDGVSRLVHALSREKDLLLQLGGRRDVRGQRGGYPLLGDVEGRERPEQSLLDISTQCEPVL